MEANKAGEGWQIGNGLSLTTRPICEREMGTLSVLRPFLHERGMHCVNIRERKEREGDTEKARTVVSRRGRRGRWRGSASATEAARGCSFWEPVPYSPAGASPGAEAAAAHRRRRPPRTAPSWEPLAGPLPRSRSLVDLSLLLPLLSGSSSSPGGRRVGGDRGAKAEARSGSSSSSQQAIRSS